MNYKENNMLQNVINRYAENVSEELTSSEEGVKQQSEIQSNDGQITTTQPVSADNVTQDATAQISQPASSETQESTFVPKKLEEMTSGELINELKKWQRIAEERKVTTEKLQSELKDLDVESLVDFIKESKEDFWGAYRKYADKLSLPSYDFVVSQTKVGDIESQVEAYQNEVIVPEIMEKYGIEEFEFNPQEAWIPKTPSYEFRVKTEEYTKKLKSKFEEDKMKAEEFVRKAEERKKKDIEELKTYFDNEEEFNEMLNKFTNPEDISILTDPEKHILSLKNLFRGYYFDELVSKIVKREVDKVHSQYAKLGIKLPKTDVPVDVSNLKDTSVPQQTGIEDERFKYSPLLRTIKRVTN